jgi:hypothetical protein
MLGFLAIHFWPVWTGKVPENQNSGSVFLSLMVAYFMMAMLSNPWGKEKRTRQFVRLPVSLLHVRMSHALLYVFYWVLLVSLFLIFTLVSESFFLDYPTFLILCVQTGIAFVFYSLFGFVLCFPDSVGRKSVEVFLLLFFVFISIAGVIHTYQAGGDSFFIDRVLYWLYRSKLSAALWLILGFGFVFLAVRYARRKSYADV